MSLISLNNRMPISPIFNPSGDDAIGTRSIWFGNTTNLMQLNDVRYAWAVGLYQQMRENFWIPQKIDVTQDVTDYNNLTLDERRAYDGILSYLTFLDSVQTCNIPHLKSCVTAPEISLCMAEQISQEAMHNQSYQYLIETIIPSDKRAKIYDLWRTNEILKNRCEFIASSYQQYIDEPTQSNYLGSLVANYILEGLYFYNGFQYFYNLASRHLMSGSADIFRMINRDELSHVRLYQKLIVEALQLFPEESIKEGIASSFLEAVNQEINWSNHIIGNQILGITKESIDQYTKYLANIRLKAIGMKPIFTEDKYKKSPYSHLEKFADTQGKGHTKSNFFEATVTSYVMSSGLTGWEDL